MLFSPSKAVLFITMPSGLRNIPILGIIPASSNIKETVAANLSSSFSFLNSACFLLAGTNVSSFSIRMSIINEGSPAKKWFLTQRTIKEEERYALGISPQSMQFRL
ncbi:unnamed protein product [Phyllotreta striolata]|uniref:Uncharacterized protein n=1 Tax=Phyllotreta striolata TaxID=444603 RepID=A0A9N9TLH5_PHYSR|nr:unnamed protein product [Phyllotreta striolata]